MKLRQMIEEKNYGDFKVEKTGFDNYYDTLSQELYGYDYNITHKHHENVEKSGRVKRVVLREWICTDTNVGFYLYLVDDEPVCCSYQSGRKNYPSWSFVSEETHKKVFDFFEEYKPLPDRGEVSLLGDYEEISFVLDDLEKDINANDMGYPTIYYYDNNILDRILVNFDDDKHSFNHEFIIKNLEEILEERSKFINSLDNEKAIERATNYKKDIVEKYYKIIEKYNQKDAKIDN